MHMLAELCRMPSQPEHVARGVQASGLAKDARVGVWKAVTRWGRLQKGGKCSNVKLLAMNIDQRRCLHRALLCICRAVPHAITTRTLGSWGSSKRLGKCENIDDELED